MQQRTPDRTWQSTPPARTPVEVNNVQQQRDRGNIRSDNFSRSAPQPQPQPQVQQPQPQRSQPAPQRAGGNGDDKRRPR